MWVSGVGTHASARGQQALDLRGMLADRVRAMREEEKDEMSQQGLQV